MPDNKLFSKSTLLLFTSGLAVNVLLVWLTDVFKLPVYLDSIGTVISAALGGALPGIAVGFFSNCVTSLLSVSPDPMTLYYGFLNVLIAVSAAELSRRGLLRKWYGLLMAMLIFSLIGGALGSVVTWILYGFSFGQGVSAPLANFFFDQLKLSEFSAQFAADMGIDILDKTITVAMLYMALRLLPAGMLEKLPLGHIYLPGENASQRADTERSALPSCGCRTSSIRTKITLIIVASATILGVISLTISSITYKGKLMEQYKSICEDTVRMMLPKIDGDKIERYLSTGSSDESYRETERELYDIFENSGKIKYMYVYNIQPDGCHVVFDLDTDGLNGETAGTIVGFDESFPHVERLLAGEDIPPVITDDTYGWLLTVYSPIRDSSGKVTAYAAADIDMQEIKTNMYSFCIGIASLMFGVMVLITAFSLWYCDRKLLAPMGTLVRQARNLDFIDGGCEICEESPLKVETGDEIEEVFEAMRRTEEAITRHVAQLTEKNLEISLMQRNIIYTLANMVENRDSNTGGHIKRTADFVLLIAKKLRSCGYYCDILNDEYIKKLFDSAPLHDIGKIKIPDAVLNKPGKLTADEFSLMKTHTTEGADMLRTSLSDIEDDTWLSMAIDMAEYHHERWDGSGYPKGLSENAIPLCARIMAVSDVFDALMSSRSYKAAFSFEESMKLITDGAGTQFDPVIVKVFTASKDEVLSINSRYR